VEGEADHLVIVLVLFGGSKLPDLAKSLDDAKDGQTLFPRLPRHAMWVGDGERQHRDRPLTWAILRRHGLAVTKRAEGCGGGAGRRRGAGAGTVGEEGLPGAGILPVAMTRSRPPQRGQARTSRSNTRRISAARVKSSDKEGRAWAAGRPD
jgi:hypothetical protein